MSYLLHPTLHEDRDAMQEIIECLGNPTNSICITTNSKPKFNLLPDYNYVVRRYKAGLIELVG
jgi:hypothetical protein